MSSFQLFILGLLMAAALVAALMLGGVIPGFSPGTSGGKAVPLTIWGTVSPDYIQPILYTVNGQNNKIFDITYVQKNVASYEEDLVDALSEGKGPDLWFLSPDSVLKNRNKAVVIPYASFPQRAFKDIFIEEGELYFLKTGIVAIPYIIDPMVLYWNRDLFTSAAISQPPKFWDEFMAYSQKLTVRDKSGNIAQSGASFGEFQNVDHAEDIVSFLIMQSGNPIVNPATLESTLGWSQSKAAFTSIESAIRFFTEFSDPAKTTYSWNRSLPDSKDAFIGGILAMYFGYAGEYRDIAEKNPHLNFDVAEIPQIKNASIQLTFGKMQGLAVSKFSLFPDKAITAAVKLTEKDPITKLSEKMTLPPVRRDLLSMPAKDPVLNVFYKSAVKSRAWLKPDPEETFNLFKNMIESVLTGKKKISEALADANSRLDDMLKKAREQEQKEEEARQEQQMAPIEPVF